VPVEVSCRAIYENGLMVGVQGTGRDITERRLAQDALQMFSRQLIEGQEDERRRIARELHDQIGQVLTAIKMNLHAVQQDCNTTEARSHVKDNIEAVDEALRLVRDLSIDLRPPLLDDLGLVTALRWYVDRYAKRTGLNVDVVIELPDENDRFSRELETACFRIAQEALTNIVRHAQASRVLVQLSKAEGTLCLSIKDDGVGFNVEGLRNRAPRVATLGLISMQERAHAAGGTVDIDSAPSRGTEVRFSLQLESEI
ncbi:MAG TPA: PAS domain-containing sensor histidine kinase, partial [Pyrinomonadaceae bacterium]|nr:PAS domain-containing sensor histidine kinase [Pyrinomonadaceae bacterium]